jgi:GNAT superfamily N-acetyltransferase
MGPRRSGGAPSQEARGKSTQKTVSSVEVRVATIADIRAMAALRAAEWGDDEYWSRRISGYMVGEIDPQQALKPRIVLVAADGDAVVGFIAGHLTRRYDCDGELEWINVDAAYRGRGVSSRLLQALAQWFVEHDARRVCVDVEPHNAIARRFYAKHGAVELKPHWMVWENIGLSMADDGRQ